jgi:hypothetical protein
VEVEIIRVEELEEMGIEESELDEMWSYVGKRVIPGGCGTPLNVAAEKF